MNYVCVTCRKTNEVEECIVLGHKVEVIYPVHKDRPSPEDLAERERRRKLEEERKARNDRITKANR